MTDVVKRGRQWEIWLQKKAIWPLQHNVRLQALKTEDGAKSPGVQLQKLEKAHEWILPLEFPEGAWLWPSKINIGFMTFRTVRESICFINPTTSVVIFHRAAIGISYRWGSGGRWNKEGLNSKQIYMIHSPRLNHGEFSNGLHYPIRSDTMHSPRTLERDWRILPLPRLNLRRCEIWDCWSHLLFVMGNRH